MEKQRHRNSLEADTLRDRETEQQLGEDVEQQTDEDVVHQTYEEREDANSEGHSRQLLEKVRYKQHMHIFELQ